DNVDTNPPLHEDDEDEYNEEWEEFPHLTRILVESTHINFFETLMRLTFCSLPDLDYPKAVDDFEEPPDEMPNYIHPLKDVLSYYRNDPLPKAHIVVYKKCSLHWCR
uniref:Uncharacterized protein n=1 Tax=Echinococcus canadensis TaxID=519352 RepID=A0A915EWD8_9CEST